MKVTGGRVCDTINIIKKKILIIEDENYIQLLLQEVLSDRGYETHHATSGKLGIELANDNHPKLILLDLMLPGTLNGFAVLKALKSQKTTKSIPVLVLTNLDSEKEETLKLGAAGYFVKSNLSLSDLLKAIKKYL